MKLTSSLIFLIVLIAGGFCADTTTSVNPIPETTTASVQTTTVTDTTTVPTTSPQPDSTTVSPSTTTNLPTTSSTEPPTTTTLTTTTVKTITTSSPDTTTSSKPTTAPPVTTTKSPDTTTSSKPTTVPPVTTTKSPDTTTSSKPTTVPPATTTKSPDTTTSSKPTTVPPATTTKSPEPPTPVEGSWNVTEGNLTCIRADLKVRFRIPVKDHVEYILLSPNATSSGSCKSSNTTQELQLEESEYTLTMIFEKDSKNAYMKNVTFTYTLPDGSGFLYNDNKLFTVKIGNSYMCDSSNNINLKNVTMEVFRIHIQFFGSVEKKDFGTAEECEADNRAYDMVPPAVGIVLLILMVVVLVAYFFERRRSRQKGYRTV